MANTTRTTPRGTTGTSTDQRPRAIIRCLVPAPPVGAFSSVGRGLRGRGGVAA